MNSIKHSLEEEDKVYVNLINAFVSLEVDRVKRLCDYIVREGINPLKAIEVSIKKGLEAIGDKFEKGEMFLPELILSAKVAEDAVKILLPSGSSESVKKKGKFVIGTVKGDIHDLGKNIVATMLRADDFEVFDMGINVSVEAFIDKVKEVKPDILGLSALLMTTIAVQKEVIDALKKEGIRNEVMVMVGGVAVTSDWAHSIGADAYADNAVEAVKKVNKLLVEKVNGRRKSKYESRS